MSGCWMSRCSMSRCWMSVSLPDCQATEEEYKRLLAICVGSQHVAFNCQMFDFEEEHQDTHTKVVGKRKFDEVAGVGGEEGPQDGTTTVEFLDLKKKPLGHTLSILFWTPEQQKLRRRLEKGENVLLYGDYGTGKTSLLVFAALEAAKDPSSRVIFIPATNISRPNEGNAEYILDEAMRMKFEGTSVEVATIGDLRQLHGQNATGDDDRHHLIREFIKRMDLQGSGAKLFIDELPMYQKDLVPSKLDPDSTELADTLKVLQAHSLINALFAGQLRGPGQGSDVLRRTP